MFKACGSTTRKPAVALARSSAPPGSNNSTGPLDSSFAAGGSAHGRPVTAGVADDLELTVPEGDRYTSDLLVPALRPPRIGRPAQPIEVYVVQVSLAQIRSPDVVEDMAESPQRPVEAATPPMK